MVWSRHFIISMRHKVTETANSQNQTIKPAYFIIWLQVRISLLVFMKMSFILLLFRTLPCRNIVLATRTEQLIDLIDNRNY